MNKLKKLKFRSFTTKELNYFHDQVKQPTSIIVHLFTIIFTIIFLSRLFIISINEKVNYLKYIEFYGSIILVVWVYNLYRTVIHKKIRLSQIAKRGVKGVIAHCITNDVHRQRLNESNNYFYSKLVFLTELGEVRTIKIRKNLRSIKSNDSFYIVYFSKFDIQIIR